MEGFTLQWYFFKYKKFHRKSWDKDSYLKLFPPPFSCGFDIWNPLTLCYQSDLVNRINVKGMVELTWSIWVLGGGVWQKYSLLESKTGLP